MSKEDLKSAILAGLALFSIIYLMLLLGEKILASFLAFAGVSMFSGWASYRSEISLAKYKAQLEVFDAIIYVGILLVALSMFTHTAQMLGWGQYLPSGLTSFASVSQTLETAIMIFAAIKYAQHPTKPNWYAWLALLCVFDMLLNKATYQNMTLNPVLYLVIGLSVASICLGVYFGISVPLTAFSRLFALLVGFTGITLAADLINKSNFFHISMPSWLPSLSTSLLLGVTLFLFIEYLFERKNPTYPLAGASIWALAVYGVAGLTTLLNLALFSIAVFILIAALGA